MLVYIVYILYTSNTDWICVATLAVVIYRIRNGYYNTRVIFISKMHKLVRIDFVNQSHLLNA